MEYYGHDSKCQFCIASSRLNCGNLTIQALLLEVMVLDKYIIGQGFIFVLTPENLLLASENNKIQET